MSQESFMYLKLPWGSIGMFEMDLSATFLVCFDAFNHGSQLKMGTSIVLYPKERQDKSGCLGKEGEE